MPKTLFSDQLYLDGFVFILKKTKLSSFWIGFKDLLPLHNLDFKLSKTVKTDVVISGTKDVDPHRRFRGGCVNVVILVDSYWP